MFSSMRPTPELSFAVRYLKTSGGIMITASHNPPMYNGLKIYDKNGCQCITKFSDKISEYIDNVDIFNIKISNKLHGIEIVDEEVDHAYYDELMTVQEKPIHNKNIKVVYTPLQGVGYRPVKTILSKLDYEVDYVECQCCPDKRFSQCKFINPENVSAFDKAIELAKKTEQTLF